jgi:hypothetical protein
LESNNEHDQYDTVNNAGLASCLRLALAIGHAGSFEPERTLIAAAAKRLAEIGDPRPFMVDPLLMDTRPLEDWLGKIEPLRVMSKPYATQDEWEGLTKERDELRAKVESLKADHRHVVAERDELRRVNEQLRGANDQLDKANDKLRDERVALVAERDLMNKAKNTALLEVDRLKSALAEANSMVAVMEDRVKGLRQDVTTARDAAAQAAGGGQMWFWEDGRDNGLESMVASLPVVIRAGALQALLAERWKPPVGTPPRYLQGPDGIRIEHTGNTPEGCYANYAVHYPDADAANCKASHYAAIQVVRKMSSGREIPWFAAVERRLLTAPGAEPTPQARSAGDIVRSAEILARTLFQAEHGSALANQQIAMAMRHSSHAHHMMAWDAACKLLQQLTGEDAKRAAEEFDEIPF